LCDSGSPSLRPHVPGETRRRRRRRRRKRKRKRSRRRKRRRNKCKVEAHGAGVSVRNWTDDQGECTSYKSVMCHCDARRSVSLFLVRRAIPLPGAVVIFRGRR